MSARPCWSSAGLLACVLLLTALPAGASSVAEARALWEQGEVRDAVLGLKGHLQQEPLDVEARILLAEVYVDLLQGAAALQELDKAREAGASRERLVIPLAEALLLQGEYYRASDELLLATPGDDREQAQRLALRGEALRGVGDAVQAAGLYQSALALDPAQARALLGQAHLALVADRREQARALTRQATDADPNLTAAWELAAELAVADGDLAGAEVALIKAELVARNKWPPRFKRALLHIEQERFDEAAADLDRVADLVPNFSGLEFARGALALRKGETSAAIAALQAFLKRDPGNLRATWLLGVAEARRGNLESAESMFRQYHKGRPRDLDGVLALAQVLVSRNDPGEADQVLTTFVDAATAAPANHDGQPAEAPHEALAALADVRRRRDQPADVAALLARAVAAAPQNADYRIAYAEALLAVGQHEQALAEIDQGATLAPARLTAQLLRIRVRLKLERFAEARELAEALAGMHPQDPRVQNALGLARIGSGQPQSAQDSFRAALAADPGHADAALNLGRLLLNDGDLNGARKLFDDVLARVPGNPEATLALAELDGLAGDRPGQLVRLEAALITAPTHLATRVALARALLVNAEPARALTLTQSAPVTQQRAPELLIVQGEAEIALGKVDDAVSTYQALAAALPSSAVGQYLLTRVYALAGEEQSMRAALLRAVALDPGHALAPETLALAFEKLRDHDQRRAFAGELIEASNQDPRLIARKADVLVADGDAAGALELLEGLAGRYPDDAGVLAKLAQIQQAVGDPSAALETLAAWAQRRPADSAPLVLMAQTYAAQGAEDQALALLLDLAGRFPGNALILNNTAWLLRERDPPRARQLAEQAYRLQPRDPLVLDTLASLLLAQGEGMRALLLLEQARGIDQLHPTIAYHHALALVSFGRTDEAREVLVGIIDRPFAEQAEARKLLNTIAGKR